jgi:cephalosporin hydroxylase
MVFGKSYFDVYKDHTGFVSNKWIQYFFIYDLIFEQILEKDKPITLLEIGVQNGGSLEIWKKYFPEGSRIYGVDIDPKCCELNFSDNIEFHLGSAADKDFMNETFKDKEFDVIIDDGSHICKEVIDTFLNMFTKIKWEGIYVIEDLHTGYYKKRYGGGFRKQKSSVEFFKRCIDALNYDYIPKNKFFNKKQIHALKEYNKTIKSMSFYNSVCAISKYGNGAKTEPFQLAFTGNIEKVEKITTYRKTLKEQENAIKKTRELYLGQ